MLLRKHQYIALVSGSLSVLALVNCSDNDTVPGGEGGSSSAGKAGATTAGGGSAGKASAGSNHGGADSQAGDSSEGGDESVAGKPAGGSSGAGSPGGSSNTSDAGSAGSEDDGGAAGAGEPPGPHVGAILKYTFDAGAGAVAVDSSGSGFNGTLAAAATGWTAQGRNGAGLALLGGVSPTTYVTVPPGVFTDVKSTTLATWVKLSLDVPWARIFDFSGKGVDAAARFMYLTPNTDRGLLFSTFGGDPTTREAVISTGTLLPVNVWKHVAVTIADGGKRSIYIDGFPAAEATTVDVPPSELEPLSTTAFLGKSRFPADAGLAGALDEFQVYDRVLAPAEIATLAAPKADYTRIPFDEASGTASTDTSTRAVNATLNGGATWATGRLGAAVQLSGVLADAQYVTLSNPIAGCTDSLTIALWVKEVAAASWARIFDFGNTDNFMFLTPSTGDGKMQLSIYTPTKETVVLSATTIPADSTWHHVAVVVTTAAASLYVDGNVVGNTALPVTPSVLGNTTENWLGKSRFTATDPYFNGSLDEVRISCRAFTSDEIKSLAFKPATP
ncbi:MAG: LamG domain-containing protein [Polyangiaceae bacterium]